MIIHYFICHEFFIPRLAGGLSLEFIIVLLLFIIYYHIYCINLYLECDLRVSNYILLLQLNEY